MPTGIPLAPLDTSYFPSQMGTQTAKIVWYYSSENAKLLLLPSCAGMKIAAVRFYVDRGSSGIVLSQRRALVCASTVPT